MKIRAGIYCEPHPKSQTHNFWGAVHYGSDVLFLEEAE